MKEIFLTQGKVAIVDDDDFQCLSSWKWHLCSNGRYAGRCEVINGRKKTILMHRQIVGAPAGTEVDHKNLDKLDNQKHNLRICLPSQNRKNRPARRDNVTGLRGVRLNRETGRFGARIYADGSPVWLGYFPTKEEAYSAYLSAARRLHGEFATIHRTKGDE